MPRSVPWIPGLLGAAALVSGALGCGGGGGGGGGSVGTFGLDRRTPVSTLTFPLSVPTPGSVEAYDAFPNVRFSSPTFVGAAPGDGARLFVLEQRGRIRVFPNSPGATGATMFLDLSAQVSGAGGEEGLLGLAFDPGYAVNRTFYVCYVASSPRRSVLARYRASTANPDVADPTETVLLTQAQPYSNHNGGMLAFGPDGFLYLSLGDGGSAGDPGNRGLDTTTILGKILRLDVHATEGALPYAIPADNPFAPATDGTRREIYAFGLRNPWRFSFDRTTGDLWAGDVGQDAREEVDLVRKGGNYGWRAMEGTQVYSSVDLGRGPFDAPVHDYGRSEGTAVIGGYAYRGAAVPALYGSYVYADNGSGRVWALSADAAGHETSNVEITSVSEPSSFGEDATGELLVVEYGGRVLRLRPSGGGSVAFPARLSETGIYSSLSALAPSPGLVPYDVNAALWSDGARKDRLIALPGAERIAWSRDDPWAFPVGTVLVKTFRLPLVRDDPASAVKVETRVLILSRSGWEGYSYRWRDDQSDADLLAGADARTLSVADPTAPGGSFAQTWTFPSRSDCLRCHTSAAGRVLGLSTRQLNRVFDYGPVGGRTDNQLRAWDHIGLFDVSPPDAGTLPAHPAPADVSAPVAARARAVLDVNCSMCHRPGGTTGTALDLRATTPVAGMNVVGVAPAHGALGLANPFLVASGDKAGSVLWLRMHALGADRMPPLGTTLVDAQGAALVGAWIDDGP